jgi:fatty-acid desaturase
MADLLRSLDTHRVRAVNARSVLDGEVRWSPLLSLWFTGNAVTALVGGVLLFRWSALLLFVVATAIVLLFGHSLGSHRKLIHDSFQCPCWLEYTLVYLGVQVGLAGPLGLLKQHELRDHAQRLPDCHPFLRHGRGFWTDAWWQLHCELKLSNPPPIHIEKRIASNRFYQFLERTRMWQQLPIAVLLYVWGGWSFVVYGVCARVTAGVFGHWLIGYFAHNHGPVHHEVRGTAVQGHNVPWTSLLTMGECWHNNHHAFPGSARLGLKSDEWDPGWWMLLAMRKVGLVWSLRLPEHLAHRPELVALPAREPARNRGTLVWPGRTFGTSGMRRLIKPAVQLKLDVGAARLTFRTPEGRSLQGLPALFAGILQDRGVWARMAALILMPAAISIECGRNHLAALRSS